MTDLVARKLEKMRHLELQLFVIEFSRASQLDRSFSNSHKPKSGFRKGLVKTCLDLISLVDVGTISNMEIRKKIKSLSQKYGVSYGQAQKVVNVCLKQYVFLTQKFDCVNELDCPLDSTTMNGCHISHNKMYSVKEEDYKNYQNLFDKKFALKVLKDEEYDKQRINNYVGGEI
jgi:hypothetical protein